MDYWGDRVTSPGADTISVRPASGVVSFWDRKYLSANKSIKMAEAFDFAGQKGADKLADLMGQAEISIQAANLLPEIRSKALADIPAKNFNAHTVGAGNVKNSVPMRFCCTPQGVMLC